MRAAGGSPVPRARRRLHVRAARAGARSARAGRSAGRASPPLPGSRRAARLRHASATGP